jgi:hypothetical protein
MAPYVIPREKQNVSAIFSCLMELTVSKKCAGRVLSATGIKKIKIGVGLSDRHFF